LKPKKHKTVRLTRLFEEAVPEDLIRWLNDGPTTATRNVASWIDETHRIMAVAQELGEGCNEKGMALLEQIAERIDAIISKYRATPQLFSPELWQDCPRFTWQLERHLTPAECIEWCAVLEVMRLSDRGALLRVRRCSASDCRRWYYGKFPHMRFCSAGCKQRHKTSSEDFKAHRREYMKAYYRKYLSATSKRKAKEKGAKKHAKK
jgi:hypothetical protein